MVVSAEVRWFWRGDPPAGLKEWFCKADHHGCPAGGGKVRVDEYLREPSQTEVGIKRRGGQRGAVEMKGLVAARWGCIAIGPFSGPIELWSKWTTESLELPGDRLISVQKKRFIRAFDTAPPAAREITLREDEQPANRRPPPVVGCHVELSRVELTSGDVWWTLGFEAFGNPRTVENDLCAVAVLLAARHPPHLAGALRASYPAWLAEHAPPP